MEVPDSLERRLVTVRTELTVLVELLRDNGYQFHRPKEALLDPDPNAGDVLRQLEQELGPIPAALSGFYLIVGSVDFSGQHPDWSGCEYPDPIMVEPIAYSLVELRSWKENCEDLGKDEVGAFELPISPDYYHKENVSGGPPYAIQLPDSEFDPPLLNEWHETTFLGFLDLCIRYCGFPGLARCSRIHTWPLDDLKSQLWSR